MYPVLQRVECKRNDHHDEDEFNVGMSFKNRQSRNTKVNHLICICVLDKEDGQFRKSNDHKPDEELNVVNPVVDMLVQLFPCVPIDVLSIMNR